MNSDRFCKLGAILTLCLPCVNASHAADVFTWQDDNGVTHYSQWAPEDDETAASKLIVNANNPPGYDPAEDPYSIRNQASRVNAVWKSVEERKETRRKRKQDEMRRSQRAEPYSPTTDDAFVYYSRPYYRPPQRPGHGPGFRPHPPLQFPPQQKPIAGFNFAPDPMRSAHIGVRRRTTTAPPARIE